MYVCNIIMQACMLRTCRQLHCVSRTHTSLCIPTNHVLHMVRHYSTLMRFFAMSRAHSCTRPRAFSSFARLLP